MNKLISNFIFLLQKPKVTIITGEGRQCTKEAIFQVLNQHFKIGKDILVFETDLNDSEKFEFLAKISSLPVLVATQIGDALSDKIRKLAEILPTQGYLVFNFDDETTRGIKDGINAKTFSFGLQEKADFFASDIKINGSTNFKVNYHGNIVPIWLEGVCNREQIYSALAAIAVGTIFGLNLVEISQALKGLTPTPNQQ